MTLVSLIDTATWTGSTSTVALTNIKAGDVGIISTGYSTDMGNPTMTYDGETCVTTQLLNTSKNGTEVEYSDIWWFAFPVGGNANFYIANTSTAKTVMLSSWRNVDVNNISYVGHYEITGTSSHYYDMVSTPSPGGLFYVLLWGSYYTPSNGDATSIQTVETPKNHYYRTSYKIGDGTEQTITGGVSGSQFEMTGIRLDSYKSGAKYFLL